MSKFRCDWCDKETAGIIRKTIGDRAVITVLCRECHATAHSHLCAACGTLLYCIRQIKVKKQCDDVGLCEECYDSWQEETIS